MACKAIVHGHILEDYWDEDPISLHKHLINLAISHHPYEDALTRLKNVAKKSVEPQLSTYAALALAVLEGKQSREQRQRRCFCEDCDQPVRADSCQSCGVCGVAVFCSPTCKRASRLGAHASCYVSRICWADAYPEDTALYLIALLGCGRHWLHRMQALFRLAHHLGGSAPHVKEQYSPVPAECRLLLTNGLAAALGLFLEQLGPVLAERHAWPSEWLEGDDPQADWGLGAAASRALRLVWCLCSARPSGLGGVEWGEGELARHGTQMARLGAGAGGGGSSGALAGLVALCVNAAPSFPRAARGVSYEALLCLHSLSTRAASPQLRRGAAGAAGALSGVGLRGLLAPPRRRAGQDGGKDASRWEVALQCLLKLLAGCQHGRELRRALGETWPLLLRRIREVCAPALRPPQPGPSASASKAPSSASSSSASPAAAAGMLGGFAALAESCRRQGSISPAQVSAAVSLLLSVAGHAHVAQTPPGAAAGGGPQVQPAAASPAPAPASAGVAALREAALDALCAHGGLLGCGQVTQLLPAVGFEAGGGAAAPAPASPSSSASPSPCRLLPRGVELAASWAEAQAPSHAAGGGVGGGGGSGDDGASLVALYGTLRHPLWQGVRQLEDTLAVSPGNSASLCLRGSPQAEALLRLAAAVTQRVRLAGTCAGSDLVAAGAAPALARCVLLARPRAVRAALAALLAAACPPPGSGGAGPGGDGAGGAACGGCVSKGIQDLQAVLAREQRTVLPTAAAAAPAGKAGAGGKARGGGGAAAAKFTYGVESGLERLVRLATDPRVALDSAGPADATGGGEAGACAEADEATLVALQVEALRCLSALVAGGDVRTALRLLAAPGLAALVWRVGEQADTSSSSDNGSGGGGGGGLPPLRSQHPMLWWALAVLVCAVAVAVPRWRRAAAAGELAGDGAGGAGGSPAAAPPPAPGAAGGAGSGNGNSTAGSKGGKKGKGGGGAPQAPQAQAGGAPSPSPSSSPSAPASELVTGLRVATWLMDQVAPGRSLLEPLLSTAATVQGVVQRADPLLYGVLEAAVACGGGGGDGPCAAVYDPGLRAARAAELRGMLAALGWGGGEGGEGAAGREGAAGLGAVGAPVGGAAPAGGGGAADDDDEVVIVSHGEAPGSGSGPASGGGADAAGGRRRGNAAAAAAAAAAAGGSGTGSAVDAARVCGHCGAQAGQPGVGKLRKCAGCRAVRYCSQACQAAAWPAHKAQCLAAQAAQAGAGGGPASPSGGG